MFIDNLAYEASAGSGKTFMLVVRYLSLLFLGASPSKILALTFTNKAANEMQERIVQTLENLENRGELDEIVRVSELSKEYILQERKRVLNIFLASNAGIMTIDSFFTKILRKFSLYVSLMPDFSTYGAQHEIKLLLKFLREVNIAGKRDALIALSIESDKRFSDIFALLDEFYISSIELSNIDFQKRELYVYENLALEAFRELKKIVESCSSASSRALEGVNAQTFQELTKKAWIGRETLNYATFSKCYTKEMDEWLLKINKNIKLYYRSKEQNFFYALKELSDIYIKAKKSLYTDDSELSFSDVTYLVYEILKLLNDSDFLYFRLDANIEHILLDEFQDTSIIQYEILKPLIEEITSGRGTKESGSFFFVGDAKQSIYRFRGGVSGLFRAVLREQHTHCEPLSVNYRSKQEVVEFVNTTFKDKIYGYTSQQTKEDAKGGFVEVQESSEILNEVVLKVEQLLLLGARADDIAILCATNGDGEEIKEALKSKGIDVVTETTTKLINQKSIKAILEYLKYQYFMQDIYKYNFFSLISQDVKDIQKVDFTAIPLIDIIKNAVDEYKLFGNDFDIIKFLAQMARYSDIEALLFEYERLDSSTSSSMLGGVRVLTIHKSKGLEYEYVLVMDRLKKAPSPRDVIIYEYDDITLKNIYLRIKGRDELDIEYKKALQKENALVQEDTLNALYVAFTRAKEALFIFYKQKDSIFEKLEFSPKKYGILEVKDTKGKTKESEFLPLVYKRNCYGAQSDILKSTPQTKDDLKSINFGIALHYMLEMLSSFDISSVDEAKDMMINKYGYLLEYDEVEDIKTRVKMAVTNRDFLNLLSEKYYKEKAIKYRKNLNFIDLLVKDKDKYRIIDYKSSQNYTHLHIEQVSYYKEALEAMGATDVEGYICYLLKDRVEIVKI